MEEAEGTAASVQPPTPDDVPRTPSPALAALNMLVGRWSIEGSHVLIPDTVLRGEASFEWLTGHRFLIARSSSEHPDVPDHISIIGAADSDAPLVQHYYDSRGVSRTYRMSLSDGSWTCWREAPGFWQRFTGVFSGDGRTIEGLWEKSSDGLKWERDVELSYKKVG